MKNEEGRFSLKAGLWAGVITLAYFVLSHIVGGYPHQPHWSSLEAFRGLILSAFCAAIFGVVIYGSQFHSSPENVTAAKVVAFTVLGLIAWACVTAWQVVVVVLNGWPGGDQNTLIVAPLIAFILQPILFWLRKGDRRYWGLVTATLSLGAALMWAAFEIGDHLLVK